MITGVPDKCVVQTGGYTVGPVCDMVYTSRPSWLYGRGAEVFLMVPARNGGKTWPPPYPASSFERDAAKN
jgi:hypothetical protein